MVLNNDTFIEVTNILKRDEDVFIEGHAIENLGDSFDYPCKSTIIGIWKLGSRSSTNMLINVNEIKNKCSILDMENEQHALNFLHVE